MEWTASEGLSLHLCAVAQRVFDGDERWEFDEGEDGSTRVTLHCWRVRQGLGAWLRKRLAYVQFTAERQS
jgi:hypothetical protein